jgi:uncharacterized Zn finger protein
VKTDAKQSMKAGVKEVVVYGSEQTLARLKLAQGDLIAAGAIENLKFEVDQTLRVAAELA